MCRFTLYVGPPIRLGTLLSDAPHSLVRQSVRSDEREDPLNGDGFGVAWYAPELCEEPAVFRSITPAWNNRNLVSLARVVSSSCVLAHVRAATRASGVNEANCHPFRFGRYAFAHNGDVGAFPRVRRALLASVGDAAFENVYGSTDSEHVFALFIDELGRSPERDPAARMARALDAAIERTVELVARHGDGEPSYLNLAVTDGQCAAVARFTDAADGQPESLYVTTSNVFPSLGAHRAPASIASSEPLDGSPEWAPIPPNHVAILRQGEAIEFRPCATERRRLRAA